MWPVTTVLDKTVLDTSDINITRTQLLPSRSSLSRKTSSKIIASLDKRRGI